jgi:predicted ribosome quality control (RQC) complex YloA/Tae2 family protein
MSLNWKEINLILEELALPGAQIQSAIQSAYDVIGLGIHKKGETKRVLISLSPGACRIHETFRAFPKSDKPLRFAQFLNSRVVNGWIDGAEQLGDNRIVRITVRRGENRYRLYIRLWSNAANFIVTDDAGTVLDAMRRLPKKGETTGGIYAPEETAEDAIPTKKEYHVREFPSAPGADDYFNNKSDSFNKKIDDYYAEQAGSLSLEALREQARRTCEGSMARISAALEKLRARETEFAASEKLREYGDLILANLALVKQGDSWLEVENFFNAGTQADTAQTTRIKLDPHKKPSAQAELYYEQYRKAKTGLASVQAEIEAAGRELAEVEKTLSRLLSEDNPLALAKLLKNKGKARATSEQDKKRPGLSFRRGDWLIIVGRDASENDALLRGHVKGNDMWLHARDFPGSYVFIKQRSGKTPPLDILLDAGNLALFYSKGRNNGAGDLFYTQVKYLRRVKNGPKGLVTPTQEKNIHMTLDEKRLKEMEECRVEKR